jgi:HD-GYP domain-containing protein (c-di-GMP phosphodiesterase class II)
MQDHATIGERILSNVEGYREVATIVRHHHERYDGNGYPDRLSWDEIPLLSRIIGVADAYSAMTSGRPYRAALPTVVARKRIREAAGAQFDPKVVAAFEGVLDGASQTYARGMRSAFAFGSHGQDFALRPAAAVG